MGTNINWPETIKKEARGLNEYDLGEVQEVTENEVVTMKGIVDTDKFYLPKDLVERYDGHNLRFNITKEKAQEFRRD